MKPLKMKNRELLMQLSLDTLNKELERQKQTAQVGTPSWAVVEELEEVIRLRQTKVAQNRS